MHYPKRLTLHSSYSFTFDQLLLSLGMEPMTLALLAPCSTIWATGKLVLLVFRWWVVWKDLPLSKTDSVLVLVHKRVESAGELLQRSSPPLPLLPSLLFPARPFFFLLPMAFSVLSLYVWDLLVSCGRLVPSSSSRRKLIGRFLVPPAGLGWAVPVPMDTPTPIGTATVRPPPPPLLAMPPLGCGTSRVSAVWTSCSSSCSHMRLLKSCSVRPLSCISWAWVTERLLKQTNNWVQNHSNINISLCNKNSFAFWLIAMPTFHNPINS